MNEELRAEIDELRNEINSKFYELYEKILNLQENEQPTGLWKPKERENYWFIADDGVISSDTWCNDSFDTNRYAIGNCFKTKEQAEKHLEHLKVETQLRDIAARLNKGEKIDWNNNNQNKYYLKLQHLTQDIEIDACIYSQAGNMIYCLDINFIYIAIQEIGEDRLKKYLKEC